MRNMKKPISLKIWAVSQLSLKLGTDVASSVLLQIPELTVTSSPYQTLRRWEDKDPISIIYQISDWITAPARETRMS